LASEYFQHGFARLSIDLDAGRRLERFCICARRSLGDDLHVECHRRGIGMDLNDANLGAVLVHVLIERQQLRLVRSMKALSSAARSRSAASLPSLSLLVAMKMNGADMTDPSVAARLVVAYGNQLIAESYCACRCRNSTSASMTLS
jgi:hypothetical protein